MTNDPAVQVVDNPTEERFEITVNGAPAGLLAYHPAGHEAWSLVHTEIDAAYSGQGLGTQLISQALGAMRTRGLSVLPYCPFVRSYLSKHPDQLDLVPAGRRADFGL